MKNILGPNEQIQMYIQQKFYHPKISIDSVVITNERIILRHPHALNLKKDYTDYNYKDIANVILDKGFVRSTVKLTLRFGGDPLALSDLPNSEAEKAYGIMRENLVRYQSPFSTAAEGIPPYQGPQMTSVPMANIPQAGMVCPKCGASNSPGQKFCGSCGAQL